MTLLGAALAGLLLHLTLGARQVTELDLNCHRPEPWAVAETHRYATLPGMPYDLELADRVRAVVHAEAGLTEKRMFGGLAFLIQGRMAVAVSGQGGLMIRVDPATTPALIREPHVRRMHMRGRAMDGWLRVDVEEVEAEADLLRWVRLGVATARGLPAA